MPEHKKKCNCQCQSDNDALKPSVKWSFSLIFILGVIFLAKPFISNQMLNRALAYDSYNMHSNTVRQCKKVIALEPENQDAWNLMGNSYKTLGEFENATQTYHLAIHRDPENRVALFKMGMIFAMKQKYKRAIPYFDEVRRLGVETNASPMTDPFPYYLASLEMLASCYEQSQRYEKAAKTLNELLEHYPCNERATAKLQSLKQYQPSL